jgi:hypothetical protein
MAVIRFVTGDILYLVWSNATLSFLSSSGHPMAHFPAQAPITLTSAVSTHVSASLS